MVFSLLVAAILVVRADSLGRWIGENSYAISKKYGELRGSVERIQMPYSVWLKQGPGMAPFRLS